MSESSWANELLRRILFLPPQASTVAPEIDRLHYFVIGVTMFGAVVITVVGVWFVIRYRARTKEVPREHPGGAPPRWLEAAIVAGLLGLFCFWWVIGYVQYVRLRVPPEDSLDVYVTGKQWMWQFAYPEGGRSISTLYVPTGRPIRLMLTSRDVIHSFYVPEFRVKHDVIPGRYTVLWFTVPNPGTFNIFCAELCGVGHSTMRGQVVALSPESYARWLESDRPNAEGHAGAEASDLVRAGEDAAARLGCLRCHTLDGTPHIGPTWAGAYLSTVPLQGGGTVLADPPYLTESIMDPRVKIRAGFAPVMPSYHGLITPTETAAILELMKAVRGVTAAPVPVPPPAGAILALPDGGDPATYDVPGAGGAR